MTPMIERLVVGGAALVVGLAIGWTVHGVTRYGTNTETITTFQDWRTACPAATAKDANCEIVQDILDGKTRNEVARIAYLRDKGKPALGVTLPLGVLLEPGMGISFGTDAPKTTPYRTCTAAGCVAEFMIDDKLQASLDAGKEGKLVFAGPDGKPLGIPLSLKGFAEAERAYRSNEAKRSSWFWRML